MVTLLIFMVLYSINKIFFEYLASLKVNTANSFTQIIFLNDVEINKFNY